MIEIKDISGQVKFSTPINNGAKGKFTLMKEDYIILPFSAIKPIPFKLGDYVDMAGVLDESMGGKLAKIYEITDIQKPTYNTSTGGYDYELQMNAYYWKWKNKVFKYSPEHAGSEASWSLTAALDVQLGVFLRNLKALGYTYRGTDFTFSIDSTVENKAVAMTYDNMNLLDALFSMAGEDKWNCDCWITDNVIHFGRCEFGDAVKIERGVEASDITRSESQGTYATRIYAFGSTKNIPTNYRPSDEQAVINGVVQKRLMLPTDTPYIDAYEGMSQEEAIEDVVVFDDIYPHRVGTLSDVHTRTEEVENEGGTKETVTYYRYKDAGLEFKEEYIIERQDLKIRFQSGKLNGMEFGVIFNPKPKDDTRGEQLWEVVRNEDYGRPLPDEIMFPEDGDEYILSGFDIQLVSDQYIPEAEQELKEKAQKYADKVKKDDGTYLTTLKSSWVKKNLVSRTFEFGQRVNLVDDTFFENGRISRVLGWELNLDIPWDSPIYTIGESMPYSRITDIEDKLDALTYKGAVYTGTGGTGVYLIKLNDSTAPSESNAFSAKRSLEEFLSKKNDDHAKGKITFDNGAEFGEFIKSLYAGKGGAVDKDGNAEFESLRVRSYLEVMDLIVNRLSALEGDQILTEADIIESVEELGEGLYRLHLKAKWEGYFTAQAKNNVLKGIINTLAEGSGEYYTSWMRVNEVDTAQNTIDVILYPDEETPANKNFPPCEMMRIARWGNQTDEMRQSCLYLSSSEGRIVKLVGVTKPIIDKTNYGACLGTVPEFLNSLDLPLREGRDYMYVPGIITTDMIRIDYQGKPVVEYVDRGIWSADETYYHEELNPETGIYETSDVWHNNGKWRCQKTGTKVEPSELTTDWALLQSAATTTSYEIVLTTAYYNVDKTSKVSAKIEGYAFKVTGSSREAMKSVNIKIGYSEGAFTSVTTDGNGFFTDNGWFAGHIFTDSETANQSASIYAIFMNGENVTASQYISVAKDGIDGLDGAGSITADLDNEMASVICDKDGNVTAGLPLSTKVSMYYGTEKLTLESLSVGSVTGVTSTADKSTGKVTVSSVTKDAASVTNLPITCSARYNGQLYERTLYFKISKIKQGENGEDAVIYSLLVSPAAVKVNKAGELSSATITCRATKVEGKGFTLLSSLPSGYTIQSYIDGEYSQTFTSATATVSVSKTWQSASFKLYNGSILLDEETIPILSDGADGLSSVILDLDNEMASVVCDTNGKVTSGLPITINFSMYYGTEVLDITEISNNSVSGVNILNNTSEGSSTISAITSDTSETIEIIYNVKALYNGIPYTRQATFRILKVTSGDNGENAVIYQLLPSTNTVKVNSEGNYVDNFISCRATKNDGGNVTSVTSLPSGYRMTVQKDDSSESSYTINTIISTTSAGNKIIFRLYANDILADMETIPVIKDGTDGKDGTSVMAQYSSDKTSWHDSYQTGDIWMRTSSDGGNTWGEALRIVGEDGTDGAYIEYSFGISAQKTTASSTTPPTISGSWSDAPIAVTDNYPYLWCRMINVTSDGTRGTAHYARLTGEDGADGEDGTDGAYTKLVYRWSNTKPDTPESIMSPEYWSEIPDNPEDHRTITSNSGNFTLSGGWYRSPSATSHSTTYKQRIDFTTDADNMTLVLDVVISSENYDYGYVSRLDTAFSTISFSYKGSGQKQSTVTIAVPKAGSHFIEVAYVKDSSVSSYDDMFKFRIPRILNCWISQGRITPPSTSVTWSEPQIFPTDSKFEEYIYIRYKSEMTLSMPYSEPYINEYIGEPEEFSSTKQYSKGNIVKYLGNTKVFTQSYKGSSPASYLDDIEWWSDNPRGVTSVYKYEYQCVRRKENLAWGDYGSFGVFSHWGKDGQDGTDGADGISVILSRDNIVHKKNEYLSTYTINISLIDKVAVAPSEYSITIDSFPVGITPQILQNGTDGYKLMVGILPTATWDTTIPITLSITYGTYKITRLVYVSVIEDGADGEKGERGATLRGPQDWEEVGSGYQFYCGAAGEHYLDLVVYEDNFYLCKKSHTKNARNYPTGGLDNTNGYWQLGDKIDLIATKVLLSEYAVIKNLGAEGITMKDKEGNVVFEAKDGNVTCLTGSFENVNISGYMYKGKTIVNDSNFTDYIKQDSAFTQSGDIEFDLIKAGTWISVQRSSNTFIVMPSVYNHVTTYTEDMVNQVRSMVGNTILIYNEGYGAIQITGNLKQADGESGVSVSLTNGQFVSLTCMASVMNNKEEIYWLFKKGTMNRGN